MFISITYVVLSVPYNAHLSSLAYKMVMVLLGGFQSLEGLISNILLSAKHSFEVIDEEGRKWHKENKYVDQAVSQVTLPISLL